jgi:glycosyltransferase involved in cell wall biosynthesis
MFNVAEYIAHAVDSLKQQTLVDSEFILIDDGSTDGTAEVAITAIGDDDRFCLIGRENHGAAATRNFGLSVATGDYLCFLDSDDCLSSDGLEVMYNAAVDQGAQIVTGDTLRFTSTRQWRQSSLVRSGVNTPGLKTLHTHPELLYAVGPWAKLFERRLIDGVFFPEHIHLGEDQPFVLQALMSAAKIFTVDSTVYHYRQREGGSESLTQHALSRPDEVLADLYEMVRLGRGILSDDLFDFYLRRVIYSDIWARVDAALAAKDPRIQMAALTSVKTWLEDLDSDTFNRVADLHTVPLVGILFRLSCLRAQGISAARKLMGMILSKMRFRSYVRLPVAVVRLLIKRVQRS